MDQFVVRSYGKSELALLYNPHITPKAACKKLNFWISLQPELVVNLCKSGLSLLSKSYTPAQVRLIVEALGAPYLSL